MILSILQIILKKKFDQFLEKTNKSTNIYNNIFLISMALLAEKTTLTSLKKRIQSLKG